jgi:hypothetical protein
MRRLHTRRTRQPSAARDGGTVSTHCGAPSHRHTEERTGGAGRHRHEGATAAWHTPPCPRCRRRGASCPTRSPPRPRPRHRRCYQHRQTCRHHRRRRCLHPRPRPRALPTCLQPRRLHARRRRRCRRCRRRHHRPTMPQRCQGQTLPPHPRQTRPTTTLQSTVACVTHTHAHHNTAPSRHTRTRVQREEVARGPLIARVAV